MLVSDGQDLSTADLVREIAAGLGRPARLVPVPPWVLELGLRGGGLGSLHRRLCGSLQVDPAHGWKMLGWQPFGDARAMIREAVREARD
jgi:nucleoside-diphosphate-sugar epimerase